jgi:TPR repeat protein
LANEALQLTGATLMLFPELKSRSAVRQLNLGVRVAEPGARMSVAPELVAALAARDAGAFGEAVRLLRPLAEAGHVEAQAHIASLMLHGCHRFVSVEEMNSWHCSATDAELAAFARELELDAKQALQWLQNASDHGIGPASHNLAMAYLGGSGDLPLEQRRAKVKELLTKAHAQGFTFFGGETQNEAYLQTLEGYAADRGIGIPWETRPG